MKTIIDPKQRTILKVPDKLQPAACFDLDGTIRYSLNGEFINSPDDIALFGDVEERLWQLREAGYLILGITNQGGVAYGYKLPFDVDAEIAKTCSLFKRNPFHIIKACMHHPEGTLEPFNHRSLLRKPDIGMLAICEVEAWEAGYIVDWDHSFLVGDRDEDVECANNAGIAFYWAHVFFDRPAGEASEPPDVGK
jgi:D-glycero-D-manno-heptose 1,7-bisphosphate phosphatase